MATARWESCVFQDACAAAVSASIAKWPAERLSHLRRAANQTRWSVLLNSAVPAQGLHGDDGTRPWTFVQAGDLPEMWLRDAAASVHHLLTNNIVDHQPVARARMEGLARALAHYIGKDKACSSWEPYDNGRECRGGGSYTDMRFELDSPVYVLRFFRLLRARGISDVLDEPDVLRAVDALLSVVERRLSPEVGLVTSESRPSDDATPEVAQRDSNSELLITARCPGSGD